MSRLILPAAAFAAALAAAPVDAQNIPPAYRDQHQHEQRRAPGRPVSDQSSVIRQRTDALANEIDYVQEHIEDHLAHGQNDQAMQRLFTQADQALREAMHFRRSVRPGSDPREHYEHFRVLDEQVHSLMQAMGASNDPVLRRSASRLAFADEQLHAVVAIGAGETRSEFIARQAHVLAAEAARLEQSARATISRQDVHEGGDHHGDRELVTAIHTFVDRVEHFHEIAEHEDDAAHIREDFALVDQSWHRVVDLMNRNPHGAYLSRRAQRVGAMHDQLSRVIGVKAERHTIRFNLGGIGIDLRR